MTIVILLYDQLLFRPLVAWADNSASSRSPDVPKIWVLDLFRRSRLLDG